MIEATLVHAALLPADSLALIERLREEKPAEEAHAEELFEQGRRLLRRATALLS